MSESNKNKLEPCPFCGSDNANRFDHYVKCMNCWAWGPRESGSSNRWGLRVQSQPSDYDRVCDEMHELKQSSAEILSDAREKELAIGRVHRITEAVALQVGSDPWNISNLASDVEAFISDLKKRIDDTDAENARLNNKAVDIKENVSRYLGIIAEQVPISDINLWLAQFLEGENGHEMSRPIGIEVSGQVTEWRGDEGDRTNGK